MIFLLAAIITLNPQIEKFQEQKKIIGTQVESEAAKKWENRVYLATYPRSGNHWMRYLIEESTGIVTSSVYIDPDPQHLEAAFPWGGYCCDKGYLGQCRYPKEGEIAVVKTHFPAAKISWFDQLPYTQVIRIIRHPVDAFYSFYVWEQNYNQEPIEKMVPRERLCKYLRTWRLFQEYWDLAPNVLTIRYEDLYHNPAGYLQLVLETIGYQVTLDDVDRAVQAHAPSGGLLKHFDHFTQDDLNLIETELADLLERYGYEIKEINKI
jgi:hypothetical protein